MNTKVYKYCAVPESHNTSKRNPEKLFVFVPHNKTIRDEWLQLASRNSDCVMPTTHLYFCEDHFDMPNDMENYIQYQVMGTVSQIRMKKGCVPTNFSCQTGRLKRSSTTTTEVPCTSKKQRTASDLNHYYQEGSLIEGQISIIEEDSITTTINEESLISNVDNVIQQQAPRTANKCTQVQITNKFRSKGIQTNINAVNEMTSPIRPFCQSVSTSPFQIKTYLTAIPSTSMLHSLHTIEEEIDSDISYTPHVRSKNSSPSTISIGIKSTSDCSELVKDDKKQETSNILDYTLIKILKNPRSYIGIPETCYYLIDLIEDNTSIPANNILLILRKIRSNSPFRELADDFGISPTYASKIFLKNVPIIASIMRPFLVNLEKKSIKMNLPMAFRHKYNKVSCIIDCLEIEIQKPSKALNQSLSWSEYKKANTLKYLVSCTPNGLVNYISPGYGGRVTDTCLVETCDFIKCLKPGMCVMADRGFKHVEQYLRTEGVLLVRPPSVTSGNKLTKNEARETKQIASLRIHVERVIRRLREFNMLKPHACLNHNLVKVLDDVITIACGLINLQDSLIK